MLNVIHFENAMLLGYFLKRKLLKTLKMKVIASSGCDPSTIETRSGKTTHKVQSSS